MKQSEIRDGIYSVQKGESVELISVRDGGIVSRCDQSLRTVTRQHQDGWNRAWGMWEAGLGEPTTEAEDNLLGGNSNCQYLSDGAAQ